jgi:hypothetical protein
LRFAVAQVARQAKAVQEAYFQKQTTILRAFRRPDGGFCMGYGWTVLSL